MKIFVCVKHVPDSAATITICGKNQIDERITFLLNPYDEYAVTEAVKLKKLLNNQAEVIAISLGTADAEKTVRSAMAMGADRGVLITTEKREEDSITTAKALTTAIKQECNIENRDDLSEYGNLSLIFTGKESIDMVGMQTMFRIGTYLNIPTVNNVVKLNPIIEEGKLSKAHIESLVGHGQKNIYEVLFPCVLGAARGLNNPTYPTFPDVVKARKREVKIVALNDLIKNLITNPIKYLIDNAKSDKPQNRENKRAEIINLELFAEERTPKKIDGEPSAVAKEIVKILTQEAKVI